MTKEEIEELKRTANAIILVGREYIEAPNKATELEERFAHGFLALAERLEAAEKLSAAGLFRWLVMRAHTMPIASRPDMHRKRASLEVDRDGRWSVFTDGGVNHSGWREDELINSILVERERAKEAEQK